MTTTIKCLCVRINKYSIGFNMQSNSNDSSSRCHNCLGKCALISNRKCCEHCGMLVYCSTDCMRTHWSQVHKEECFFNSKPSKYGCPLNLHNTKVIKVIGSTHAATYRQFVLDTRTEIPYLIEMTPVPHLPSKLRDAYDYEITVNRKRLM